MPHEIRIYFEGDKALKPGFSKFLEQVSERARANRCKLRPIATGGTPKEAFANAIKSHPEALNILLLDSERPDDGKRTQTLLVERSGPKHVSDCIFWMVEMMESWFHADKDALERFYGEGFNRNALAGNPNVEQIPKKDLLDGLKAATRHTNKRAYHKTRHAPDLLATIDPELVRQASPNCKKLFQCLLANV